MYFLRWILWSTSSSQGLGIGKGPRDVYPPYIFSSLGRWGLAGLPSVLTAVSKEIRVSFLTVAVMKHHQCFYIVLYRHEATGWEQWGTKQ